MNIIWSEIISSVVSLVGIVLATASVLYTIKLRRKPIPIRTLHNRDDAFDQLFKEDTSSLLIMGISLRGFLQGKGFYWLRELLMTNSGKAVKMLLLNPYSVYAPKLAQREEDHLPLESYFSSTIYHDILHSLHSLKELSRTHSQMEVRLYNDLAPGMILITDSMCLYEPYSFRENRQLGSTSPLVFIRRSREEGILMYDQMRFTFEDIWQRSVGVMDDLRLSTGKEIDMLKELLTKGREGLLPDAQQSSAPDAKTPRD